MQAYQLTITLTLSGSSESEAKEKARNVLDNLKDTCGHAPYSVTLDLDEDSCEEIELEDEDLE